ncbi:Cationic trypsin-3 [Schistosoma japonicum]|uniref:Cationic trypsin-3 n=1 Tax=Schistosoma japonicum TaxID=6182 RepID=A0A4Z2CN82_SCHJA|nr:Cationic trypsin-3 [Schistosoma japonicum]TNN05730.1 Cationic trypsin-3 [Schistosoma japonicum]TNN05731.1 Cationic trypsin-3 [Schistosoma japonicum]TNN05732.1 Cationic trypsin-3 [Schistosoma japonicum]TNN05733.1 Cationic trypsin-3 [Schistosoma japonicum]
MTRDHYDAIKQLRNDNKVLLFKPDKGSEAVLLHKSEYIQQMQLILETTRKFKAEKSNKDKTVALKNRVTKYFGEILRRKIIDTTTYNKVKLCCSRLLSMYGRGKLHKPDKPMCWGS